MKSFGRVEGEFAIGTTGKRSRLPAGQAPPSLAELERFSMEGVAWQPVAGQCLCQRFAPAGRAAEPDAGAGFETRLNVGGV